MFHTMKPSKINGIYRTHNKLFTINPRTCKGQSVYNEKIIKKHNVEYRSWNPYRSKFAAAILNGLKDVTLADFSHILYLGAATGTTVSHVSDTVQEKGLVFAVESSAVAMKKLLTVTEHRNNIIPILSDAFHPERYQAIVPKVEFIYQDISQRNQAEIFMSNINTFLMNKGQGLLMVKARSIDVSLKPEQAYKQVIQKLRDHDLKIHNIITLEPYKKDHACIHITQ